MPSHTPRPEKVGLDDHERLNAYGREIIANALLRCSEAGWLRLDEAKSPVAQYHDLHDAAASVINRLERSGLALTPAEEVDSVT